MSRIFMAWDREYMGNEFSLAPGVPKKLAVTPFATTR
ncbi:Uncharacterised protein [Mycobacteroides abscessus]|nr:Uncharacterised protein [Mycobacteroides abscessus]